MLRNPNILKSLANLQTVFVQYTGHLSSWWVTTCTQCVPEGTCHSSETILYVNFRQYNIRVFGVECLCSCSFIYCSRLIWCVVCMLFLSVLEPIAKPKPYTGHFMLQCTLDGLMASELFFLILIQEPNTLELWNKLHFEEKRMESIYHV